MGRHHKHGAHYLKNYANELVALDFFTVPTATFKVLCVFIVLSHDRRRLLHFTQHPTGRMDG